MALHDRLKEARRRTGMSQELVAERLGISRQAVTKWELGQSRPSAKNLQALAELYQMSPEDLLADTRRKDSGQIRCVNCANKSTKRSGMGFISVLTLIFMVLKAAGLVSWPWLWVLSPVWLTFLFFAAVFSVILIGGRIVKGKW